MKVTRKQLRRIIKEELAFSTRGEPGEVVVNPVSDVRDEVAEKLNRLATEVQDVNNMLVDEFPEESQTDEFYEDTIELLDKAYSSLKMASTRVGGAMAYADMQMVGAHPDALPKIRGN